MKKETELQHLRKAVDCLGEQLDAKQLNRLHRAMMFKGPAHTALMDIVEGGYEETKAEGKCYEIEIPVRFQSEQDDIGRL